MPDPFVGRVRELDELKAALGSAAAGRGSVSLIAGEPGIGKTRLAEAAVLHAEDHGVAVSWASCWEEPTSPFWPWAQLVRRDAAGLSASDAPDAILRLAGGLPIQAGTHAEADSGPIRMALFDAVAAHFRALSRSQPLLLVLDDLQWADVPSLRLLDFFARDLRDASIAIIGTYREVEVAHGSEVGLAIDRVLEKAKLMRLDGLPQNDVAALLEVTTGNEPRSDLALAVHERTGGNPLFVRELGRLLVAQNRMSEAPGALPVPEGVQGVIRRRLARLSQGCHELLQLGAVVGREFRNDILALAGGLPPDDVLMRLDEAERSRLVAPLEVVGRYAFSHALVRDVLYEATPSSARRLLHRRVGEAIEAVADSDPELHLAELAHHFLQAAQAAQAGDVEKAIDYSVRAGRRALDQLAYEEAVVHFKRALDALELKSGDPRRARTFLDLGEALLRAGDLPGARDVYARAADLARRSGRHDDLARAALGFGAGLSGFEIRLADQYQLDLLEEALKALPDEDSSLRAWVLARLSVALSLRESVAKRRAAAEEAEAMARRVGDSGALAYALSALCDATAGPEDCEKRLDLAGEIVRIAQEEGDRTMELLGRRLRIVAELEMGDLAGADADIGAFAIVAEALRQPLYKWYVPLWRGMQALLGGRFEEALRHAEAAETVGARAHSTNSVMLVSVLRWMVSLQRNLPLVALDEARVLFEAMSGYGDPYAEPYAELFEALCLSMAGRPDEARPIAARLRGFIQTCDVDSEWLPTLAQWSEAIAELADVELAAETYDMLLPHRSRFAVEGIGAALHGSIEYSLGLLARTIGRMEDAEAHFEAALDANTRSGAPVLVARVQRDLATMLAERGVGDRAAELAAEAEQTFKRHGVADRADEARSVVAMPESARSEVNMFRREGEFWTVGYEGVVVRLKDVKGLHDLAVLLARPGREVAALDLASERTVTRARTTDATLGTPGHAGELLDDEARARYKERLVDLEEDIEEADSMGDAGRGEQARVERDAIARELSAAYGLGGRPRRAGDPTERARTTVTRRIREAITRIEELHPALGRHLRNSVRTGAFCSYAPEQQVNWEL